MPKPHRPIDNYSFSKEPKDVWGFPQSMGYGPKATVENMQARIANIEAANLAAIRKLEEIHAQQMASVTKHAARLQTELHAALGEIERLRAV